MCSCSNQLGVNRPVGDVVADLPLAVCLMGPTASGKTALAVELVQSGPFEIVSVDSALVYRGMDIGTAKPTADVLRVAPHRLIDICEPTSAYSAASFRSDAISAMEDIVAKGKTPLLVGGTMLYFRALERGLTELPAADSVVRARLDHLLQTQGSHYLHTQLAQVDPASAARIHPNDPQRIQRALEVYELTGKALSDLWRDANLSSPLPFRLLKFAVTPNDRQVLRARIELRFEQMLAGGFIDEVRTLRRQYNLTLDDTAMRAVGYRQVWQYLEGACDKEAMATLAVTATCQLAKRQLTWLRADASLNWLTGNGAENREKICQKIGELGINLATIKRQ